MIENEAVAVIAQKIRTIRLRNNLTIRQLAKRTNVSQGLISKIENVKTIPSLPVFLALIQSLDISLNDFFQDIILDNRRNYLVVKKEHQGARKRKGRPGFKYQHILSRNVPNCTMEVMLLTVAPGAKGSATTTAGYEFKHILCGTCVYYINNEQVVLNEGDSLYLDGSVLRIPVNSTEKEVQMLVISFYTPEISGDSLTLHE